VVAEIIGKYHRKGEVIGNWRRVLKSFGQTAPVEQAAGALAV